MGHSVTGAAPREHVVLVPPVGNTLMMRQLAYADSLKDPAKFQDAAPSAADVTAQDAHMLVEAMAEDAADLAGFRDNYKLAAKPKAAGSSPPAPPT
jgi:non-homologous end joining protein Ku